ncbi:biotin biosynthesis protein BioC [Pirellulimonas nuda]|uniref:Biotin biosynthesis protein BioC n=1 Tax=Pirellulimonas nuda TaxID=2528009 RepID=A0A518DA18_9BACT|nr:class I SAM-dependent methyltransferase [Pirellulimonas nuda]QDU88329.1 biotin biosynthesis protein BioC [Pirellulimonas nuda]
MASPKFWKEQVRPRWKRLWLGVTGRRPVIRRRVLAAGAADVPFLPLDSPAGCDFDYPGRPASGRPADRLSSCLCIESQLTSPAFAYWLDQIGVKPRMHRKLWEQAYLLQALYERGLLAPGKRGLGFAVGEEPLPRMFAERGCEIVATDLDQADQRAQAWRETNQHMSSVAVAGQIVRGSSGGDTGSVQYRHVDMNHIPEDLTGFDFTWSTCSFEHCGSLRLGQEFIWNQMRCLKPGGVAIHTTEFNLTSNRRTIDNRSTVIFRRQDIEAMVRELVSQGHHVEPISLDPGQQRFDRHIDWPPYTQDRHLRLMLKRYAATSIGLIIRKNAAVAERRA